jgi:hypothetical protein
MYSTGAFKLLIAKERITLNVNKFVDGNGSRGEQCGVPGWIELSWGRVQRGTSANIVTDIGIYSNRTFLGRKDK